MVGIKSGDPVLAFMAWIAWLRHCRAYLRTDRDDHQRDGSIVNVAIPNDWRRPRPGEGGQATVYDDGRLEVIAWVSNELGQVIRVECDVNEILELCGYPPLRTS